LNDESEKHTHLWWAVGLSDFSYAPKMANAKIEKGNKQAS
jgi:hypothetical protein